MGQSRWASRTWSRCLGVWRAARRVGSDAWCSGRAFFSLDRPRASFINAQRRLLRLSEEKHPEPIRPEETGESQNPETSMIDDPQNAPGGKASPAPGIRILHPGRSEILTPQSWSVQFTMPCEQPENNVRVRREKKALCFDVPINLPEIHNLTLAQLILLAQRTAKSPTIHNP